MAQEVIWSDESLADLESLAEYIARDSPYYASVVVEEALEAGRSLREFSMRGRIVPEFGNPVVREIFVRDYRLIYSVEERCVAVLGIIHGARDLHKLWEEEKRDHRSS